MDDLVIWVIEQASPTILKTGDLRFPPQTHLGFKQMVRKKENIQWYGSRLVDARGQRRMTRLLCADKHLWMHITSNLEAADEQRNRLHDTPVSKQQETEAIVQKDSTYWTTEDRKMSLDVI